MTEKPTNPGDASDLRQLLEAVLEAVTLPTDTPEHARRMEIRADWVRATVKGALADDPAGIGWHADYLRGKLRTEETEATERAAKASVDRAFPTVAAFLAGERAKPVGQAQAGNRCARCRWTFDPHDKKHDGRARHRETPFCNRCVDLCQDSESADHWCPVDDWNDQQPSEEAARAGAPVFEVEQSGADSTGWDPDDPYGDVDAYERGEPQ